AKSGRVLHYDATERRRVAHRQNAKPERRDAPAATTNGHKTPAARVAAAPARGEPSAIEPTPVAPARQPVKAAAAVEYQNGHAALSTNGSVPALPALGDLKEFLIAFVVEHTGYPAEIVELDADLEADLGIDSIKKAALFGELGEQFKIAPPSGNVTL